MGSASDSQVTNVYLMKPGRGKIGTAIYSPNESNLSEPSKKQLLFLYAFSGCDSTSAFFRQGKTKFVNTFEKNPGIQRTVSIFMDQNATPDQVADAGARFIAAVYSGASNTTLNDLRLHHFEKALSKVNFSLASLPPTAAAARQHSLRVFLQDHYTSFDEEVDILNEQADMASDITPDDTDDDEEA
ncbi:hypothetical protein GE061_008939 [Apolygus lucorum]|uniref:Uncharacterized protein n=1 Tax=Apolygus lucorum TaxID=248454 RepID=A0A6A4JXV0_APOLU|nr:hypothetical protein GE061_008939 [Apolygus lucorum]